MYTYSNLLERRFKELDEKEKSLEWWCNLSDSEKMQFHEKYYKIISGKYDPITKLEIRIIWGKEFNVPLE